MKTVGYTRLMLFKFNIARGKIGPYCKQQQYKNPTYFSSEKKNLLLLLCIYHLKDYFGVKKTLQTI